MKPALTDDLTPERLAAHPSDRATLASEDRVAYLTDRATLAVWAGIAVLAGVIRLLILDHLPLSESEADLAVRAWAAARGVLGDSLVTTGTPLLAHLLAAFFFIFGPNDAAARAPSVLAGIGYALLPALLMARIGRRAAFAAGVLLAISPVAVQAARTVDAASISAALTLLIVASLVRLATDRPIWAPWSLAAGIGLALAHESSVVVALGAAGLAAAATWGWSPSATKAYLVERRARGVWGGAAGPLILGACVAAVAASGAFMNLSGLGFAFGDLWGNVGKVLTPAPFPTRNTAALLAHGWPILALAVLGFGLRVRRGDRLALFLAQWTLLLFALAAVVGQSVLALAVLPIAPATLLAAMAIDDLLPVRLSGWVSATAVGGALLVFLVFGALIIGIGQWVGANRGLPPIGAAMAFLLLMIALVSVWQSQMSWGQRGASLIVLLAFGLLAVHAGSIARMSFGGSVPGSEPLPRELTADALRDTFAELSLLASADPTRVLPVDARTPAVIRWYGRDIRTTTAPGVAPRPYTLRDAPVEGASTAGQSLRTPLKVTSLLNRGDLNPMGIARWMVSRVGLIQGKTSDIIISR